MSLLHSVVLARACWLGCVVLCATLIALTTFYAPPLTEIWRDQLLTNTVPWIAGSFIAGAALSFMLPNGAWIVASIASIALVGAWGLQSILATVALWAVFLLVGLMILAPWRPRLYLVDIIPITLIGTLPLSHLVEALYRFPVNGTWLYSGLVALIAALGITSRRTIANLFSSIDYHHIVDRTWRVALSIFFISTFWLLLYAHVPEVGNDSLSVHLPIIQNLLRDGLIKPDLGETTLIYMSKQAHWTYFYAYMLGGETSLRLFHASMIIMTALGVAWSAGHLIRSPWAYVVAGLFLFSPLTLYEASILFLDPYLTLLSLGGVVVLVTGLAAGASWRIVVAGVILGAAAAAKPQGLVWLPAFALIMTWGLFRGQVRLRTYLASGFLSALLTAVPYVDAYIGTGNPLFPFYNDIFRSPFFPPEPYTFPLKAGHDLFAAAMMFVKAGQFVEGIGPSFYFFLFAFIPPMFLSILDPKSRVYTLLGIYHFVFFFFFVNYLRYHTPGVPLLSIGIASGLALLSTKGRLPVAAISAVAGAILGLNILYTPRVIYVHLGARIPDFFTASGWRDLVVWRAPERALTNLINGLPNGPERTAYFMHAYIAGADAPALSMHPFYNHLTWVAFDEAVRGGHILKFFKARHVRHIVLRDGINFQHSEALRNFLATSAISLAEEGGARLFRIRDDVYFSEKIYSSFDSDKKEGFHTIGQPRLVAGGGVETTPQDGLYLSVPTEPYKLYRIRARVDCSGNTGLFGIRFVWVNAQGQILSIDVRRYPCTDNADVLDATVVAPHGAVHGNLVLDATGRERLIFRSFELGY